MTAAALGLVRERLRAATAAAHESLERELDWQTRIATLVGYRSLLEGLYGFHAGYEPAIGRALADERFFAARRRLDRLALDLRALGCDRSRLAALPVAVPVELAGAAAAFGALYVLEGSTLGGQVIRKTLERRHGAGLAGACAYYDGHGRATGTLWRDYCTELERRCADPVSADAALAAGVRTFDALRGWLTAPVGARAA